MSLTRWPVCSRPTRIASSAARDASVDATTSVAPSTMTTTVAMPRKMRHASPTFGAGAERGGGGAGAGVSCVGAVEGSGFDSDNGCVLSVDVAIELVVFAELVLVLHVLVAARVELVFEIFETRRGHDERVDVLAAAIVPEMNRVLAG